MKIKLNYKETQRFLKGSDMKNFLKKAGDKVAKQANAEAPVGRTGELSRSHKVDIDETDRAVARVSSDKKYAAAVAARTGYLTRALDKGI